MRRNELAMPNDVLLIIPAYNEEKNLPGILSRLKSRFPEMPILVVDDGSSNDTREIAREHQVNIVSHPINLGYGAALQSGYKYALRRKYSYVVQMDADGQHEIEDIEQLLQPVKEGRCDLAIGSRFLHPQSYRPPLGRLMGIWFFRKIIFWLTGQSLTDPTSGFQAMNLRVFQLLGDNFPVDYPDADVLLMLHYYRIKILEIPVRMYASQGGSMHQGLWRPIFYMGKLCLSLLVTFSLKGYFRKIEAQSSDQKILDFKQP